MITPQFEESYKRLNSAQKDAVDTIEGPVMVIAGPGTGKTQILTLRIANILVKTDSNPSSILVLTFSESAALQVRNRLASMIGTPAYKVDIATFHGFCNEVIRGNMEEFPHLVSSESITEVEQIEIVEKLILDNTFTYLKPFGEPLHYLRSSLSAINDLKKENVSPQRFKEILELQKEDFGKIEDLYHEKGRYKGEMKGKYKDLQKEMAKNEELSFIYEHYQTQIREQKMYDFNDMLLEVVKALETNKDLLLRLQERYQYILIDEHQDTNAAQNKIVELLCDFYDNPNLFVVGDEKQAIYRFQGASLENFLYFRSLYPSAKMISLGENYRSHQTILDAASSMISHNVTANLMPEAQTLLAMSQIQADSIKLGVFNDYHAEYQYLAESIKNKVTGGSKFAEFAVLGRNNRDLIPVSEAFERMGIPYSVNTDADVFLDPEIQKLLFILRAVDTFCSDAEMIRAMHVSFFEIEPVDIYRLTSYSFRNKKLICEVLEDIDGGEDLEIGLRGEEKLRHFYALIKSWYTLAHNSTFEHLYVTILKQSGMIESMHKSPKHYEILDKLIGLFEEAKMLYERRKKLTLNQFLAYLDLLEKHRLPLKAEVRTERTDSVKLMTAHRSKGLEFEYVYIIQVFDGHWGNSRSRSRGFKLPWEYLSNKLDLKDIADENEDERRLFFVALTRAKQDIFLSYSTKSLEGKEQLPSQFLAEIDELFLKEIDTAKFEAEFQDHKEMLFDFNEEVAQGEKSESDIEFVRNLFLERGLSVTGFGNFLQCPWRFFYRNLLLMPDVKSYSMIFGTAVHFALDQYVKSLSGKPISAKKVQELFVEKLRGEPVSEVDFEALKQKGEKILAKYIADVGGVWDRRFESEVTVRGVQFSDYITLNGRIDMIEQKSSNEVVVHDFKTGKPKSRKSIDGSNPEKGTNYLQQLVFYKILLDRHQEGKRRMVGGVIDFVEPMDSGNFKSEYFDVTEEMVKDLEKQIEVVGKQIWDLTFWDLRCGDPECEYCQLRELVV